MNHTYFSKIVLFTHGFPYGLGESFLENELIFISREFDKVYIVPHPDFIVDTVREIPDNCLIIDLLNERSHFSIKNIYSLISLVPFLIGNWKKSTFSYRSLREELAYLNGLFKLKRKLENNPVFKSELDLNTVYYSYWCDIWVTILGLLKLEKRVLRIISRAHGYDLYEERNEHSFIRYRKFQLKMLSHLYCISEDAVMYLRRRYNRKFEGIISTAKLGTIQKTTVLLPKADSQLRMISCSGLRPVKRVLAIVDILKKVNRNIVWVHVGSGDKKNMAVLKNEIKNLPSNITVVLKGNIPNSAVKKLYAIEYFDFFINVSESEGIPVSIMEAISFGIPIIATDVGGTKEIVTKETGILVKKQLDFDSISRLIEEFENSNMSSELFRQGVRKFWSDNYNAEVNYSSFVNNIKQILER